MLQQSKGKKKGGDRNRSVRRKSAKSWKRARAAPVFTEKKVTVIALDIPRGGEKPIGPSLSCKGKGEGPSYLKLKRKNGPRRFLSIPLRGRRKKGTYLSYRQQQSFGCTSFSQRPHIKGGGEGRAPASIIKPLTNAKEREGSKEEARKLLPTSSKMREGEKGGNKISLFCREERRGEATIYS